MARKNKKKTLKKVKVFFKDVLKLALTILLEQVIGYLLGLLVK